MAMLIVHSATFSEKIAALQELLANKLAIKTVQSFTEATTYCQDHLPDIMLVQNELTDGNAFDFCTRVRLLQNQQLTPFLIFSEQMDVEERVRTFQVGADEYLAEFDPEFVCALVDHEIASNDRRLKLEQEKDLASSLVVEAMKTSSELGNAINFIERCHQFETPETINAEIIRFCSTMDLNVVIGTLELNQWYFNATNGNVTELERDLMQSIHNQDRFVDFGARTQLNWPNIALLVKNMPLRDPDKYGRIKDLLPTLISSANARVDSLVERKRIQLQTDLMNRAINALQPSLESVIQNMDQDNQKHRSALSDFLQKIIVALPSLGLEDDQEEFFISRVEQLIQQADQMAKRNESHQQTLTITNNVLLELLEKQIELQNALSKTQVNAENTETTDELFELF